ncbi:MAG TPA: DUF1194 domain-containing protein, partial [Azospirillum sp.]
MLVPTGVAAAILFWVGALAAQTAVDLELVLAVVGSGSVNRAMFDLELAGHAAAFRDPTVIEAIRAGQRGRIAVTLALWSDPTTLDVLVPWTVIADTGSGEAFAKAIDAVPRRDRSGSTDLSSEDLRRLARGATDGRVCRRLLAIAMALDGVSRAEAARHAGMDRQAPRDWVVRYNAEGVDGLRDRARPGRPPRLAAALEADLARLIAAGPDVEGDGVVEYRVRHIRALALRHFGADYSRTGMQDRLHRMKLSFLTPRPIH